MAGKRDWLAKQKSSFALHSCCHSSSVYVGKSGESCRSFWCFRQRTDLAALCAGQMGGTEGNALMADLVLAGGGLFFEQLCFSFFAQVRGHVGAAVLLRPAEVLARLPGRGEARHTGRQDTGHGVPTCTGYGTGTAATAEIVLAATQRLENSASRDSKLRLYHDEP